MLLSIFAVGSQPGFLPTEPPALTLEGLQSYKGALPVAFECALQYCVHSANASFTNGALSEEIHSTWVNDSMTTSQFDSLYETRADLKLQPPPQSNKTFVVKYDAWVEAPNWLATMLTGNVTATAVRHSDNDIFGTYSLQDWEALNPSSDILAGIWTAMNASEPGFPDAMDNLAKSLSSALRALSYQPSVTGTANFSVSRFTVRWVRLTLPLLVLLSTWAFLGFVMIETRRTGLVPWGNNALASPFHGLVELPRGRSFRDRQCDMEDTAQGYLIEFQVVEDEGHLVLR